MPVLTVGMPTYDDFDGVYFTVQALNLFQDMTDCEILVIDNFGCNETKNFIENWVHNARYVRNTETQGTAYAKNQVFEHANGEYVLCIDGHILLFPYVIENLKTYYKLNPNSPNLIQGPMCYDDLRTKATHMDPVWRGQMFGIWAHDPRVEQGVAFEIPLHGMGLFSCKRDQWLWYHSLFRGFGGEEGYIHEKYRQAGRKCLCLPWLNWVHRFGRPKGVTYRLALEDKIQNYIFGHLELGQDLQDIYDHFTEFAPEGANTIKRLELGCRKELELLQSQETHAYV